MVRQKIIIDTDPGQDDAVAILLALASEELEVLGITCVAGNVELELTKINALKICELAQRSDIKVHAGSDRPLCRKLVTAKHVHGSSGLDGTNLSYPSSQVSKIECPVISAIEKLLPQMNLFFSRCGLILSKRRFAICLPLSTISGPSLCCL